MGKRRSTQPGDVVLIHLEGKPATFARVEEIRAHGRPGWYFCDLLVLGVPPQPLTWILEREQIDGTEFTMGGKPVRLDSLGELGALHARVRAATEAGSGGGGTPEPARETAEAARDAAENAADEKPTRRGGTVVKLFPRGS